MIELVQVLLYHNSKQKGFYKEYVKKEKKKTLYNYVARTVQKCCLTPIGSSKYALIWRMQHAPIGVFEESSNLVVQKFSSSFSSLCVKQEGI